MSEKNISPKDIPASWNDLAEQLAAGIHDEWMRQRRADGWTWGAERNDQRREHPNMVPYEQLTEAEKEYDRVTARAALRGLRRLGYSLTRDPQAHQ